MHNYLTRTLAILLTISFFATQAQKTLTIQDFTTQPRFTQRSVYGINWMKEGKFYTSLVDNKIIKYDITGSQEEEVLMDAQQTPHTITDYILSPDEKKILICTNKEPIYRHSYRADFYLYDIHEKNLVPLSKVGKQQYATFSPDALWVAFTRNNNLFVVNLTNMEETQITRDGQKNKIINASSDWVYEEEFGFPKAFYWSPDSKKIAYYRFDETQVKEFTLQKWDQGKVYPEEYRFKYPKAGEKNATVDIYIYLIAEGQKIKAQLGNDPDDYLPRVQWTANAQSLAVRKMNRLQNQMALMHVEATTGKSSLILTETSRTYIDLHYTDELYYLTDQNSVIIASERSGWKNLYLYDLSDQRLVPITNGKDWEVTRLVGVDEKNNKLYYLSTEGGYLNRSFWSMTLDGKKKTKLLDANGVHSIHMSPNHRYYIDYHSSATQPLQVVLYQTAKNKRLKTLESNEKLKNEWKEYGLTQKEFFTFPSADPEIELDGYFIKPSDFDPTRSYPVLVYQYSGPRAPSVMNTFSSRALAMWFHMLAQRGIIVAVVDTRGTGFRGEAFTKMTYLHLGQKETEDLIAVARYLNTLPYVDGKRLALYGWSYGGYMTARVMTSGYDLYKVGIAGAPVTDYRFYDTIYTERYMQTPQLNPQGYADCPVTHAAKLQGEFLLIHGTGDDNVHFQNSIALQDALIRAGKQFHSFYYPNQPHGFRGTETWSYLYTQLTNFLLDKL